MKKIWLMALVVLVTGCATQKRKENRARNYYLDNKDKLAELSATIFPVTDGFKKGEPIRMPSDTIRSKGDTVFVEKDCPDGTKVQFQYIKGDTLRIYIPIHQTDTIVRERTDKMDVLRSELTNATKELIKTEAKLSETQQESKNKTWWIVGLSAFIAIGVIGWAVIKYFKLQSKIGIKL